MAKILVIDDDMAMRRFSARVAKSLGHTVLEASNGVEGLSIAAKELPDLIISDLMMPVMDGLETVKLIKKEKTLKDVPIIVITAVSEKNTVLEFIELGVSYYFAKPVNFSLLEKKISQILNIEEHRKTQKSEQEAKKVTMKRRSKPLIVACEPNEKLMGKLEDALADEFQLVKTTDGASCLNTIFEKSPDAVLLEPSAAFLSGIEIMARVRSSETHAGTKFIVFSDPESEAQMADYSEFYAAALKKPYSSEQLVATVDEVLDRHRFTIAEKDIELVLKLKPGGLKWFDEQGEESQSIIDNLLLEMFETGKKILTIDASLIDEEDEKSSAVLKPVVEKAAQHDFSVVALTGSKKIAKELKDTGYENISVSSPAKAPA